MRTLILGGGYAGLLCALRLARRSRDEVLLVDGRADFVERVRLHARPRPLTPYARLLAGSHVRFLERHVEHVDLDARRADGEPFDRLVIATGSRAAPARLEGAGHLVSAATLDDAARLHAALDARRGPRVVIGGGATGIEVAAQHRATLLVRRTLEVDAALSPAAAACVRRAVHVVEGATATRVSRDAVGLSDGRALPCAVPIWAGGLVAAPIPAPGLARDASGRATVDAFLQSTSHPFVHVIGDAAASGLRMACATAMPTGAYVADRLAGHEDAPFRFAYVLRALALGPGRGLVQRVDAHDRPRGGGALGDVYGGALADWTKRGILRGTMFAMHLERRGIPYVWPRGATRALAAETR